MGQSKFVGYYRVSTARQGQSGLGLEAQRASVAAFRSGNAWELIGEYTEIETGKKATLDNRPELRAALDQCRKEKATLVIAKLDRLARNVHFVSGLIESGVDFVAADAPHANKTMLQMFAVMAEWERDQISKRTRDALAAAKARGVKLGVAGPRNLRPVNELRNVLADQFADRMREVLLALKASGLSQRAMIGELNTLGLPSPRGGRWHLPTLQRVWGRLASKQSRGRSGAAEFQQHSKHRGTNFSSN